MYQQFFNKINSKTPPIWIMRQAGRYLPEYMEIRKNKKSFLDLCYDPILASEVTLQPINRFDFDAAIIFSDILTIPHSMGINLEFLPQEGPRLEIIDSLEKLKSIQIEKNKNYLEPTYEAIKITRSKLSQEKPLIGFAGAPWTITTYIIEGRGKTDFSKCKNKAFSDKLFLQRMIDLLTEAITRHLINQIKAGANIIKIFDSWAGVLPQEEFFEFVIKPTIKIVTEVKKHFPEVPIMGFPKGAGYLYNSYISNTKIDIVTVDFSVPIDEMKKFQQDVIVQGNLDPMILLSSKEKITKEVLKLKSNLAGNGYIFNLGHGIIKETPVENVEHLIKIIREN